jgi:hypothetical protein
MAADPSFVPAQAGVAKVAAAQGDVPGAIRSYRHIVEVYPLPQYVVDLGDLLTVSGDPAGAARQYELLRVEAQLFRANGVDMDLEVAQFDAEHVVRTDEGLAAARAEFARRQSVTVADAWPGPCTRRDTTRRLSGTRTVRCPWGPEAPCSCSTGG